MSSNRKVNILMLGGAKRVSFGRMLIDAGRRHDIDVRLFSYELSTDVAISEIATVIVGKRWRDEAVMKHLLDTTDRYDIDIVVPFVDPAISLASELMRQDNRVFAPVCEKHLAEVLFDKCKSDELFRSIGMPVPGDAGGEDMVIAKPRFGSASKGIMTFANRRAMPAEMSNGDYLLQRYIEPRREITVDCYVDRVGHIAALSPRIRLETSGGEVTRTVTCNDARISHYVRRFVDLTGIKGAFTMQFLYALPIHDHSEPLIMEVNPRVGGGIVCSVHAGADIAEMILLDAISAPVEFAEAKPGVEIARYYQEVVVNNDIDEILANRL